MKSAFLLPLLVSLGSASTALALSRQEQIRRTCETSSTLSAPQNPESAAFLLNELQTKYRRLQDRVSDPNGYLSLMNRAIRKTPFVSKLQCLEKLNSLPHTSAKVVFHDPAAPKQTMSFGLSSFEEINGQETSEYTLMFSLKAPVSMALFTYLHELTHACQTPGRWPLYRESDLRHDAVAEHNDEYLKYSDLEYPDSLDPVLVEKFKALDRAKGEVKQAQFLGEVEAFHVMHEAFLALTPLSPALCFAENETGSDKMYEAYIDVETELQQGLFAQSIVWSYLDYHKPKLGFLFDTKAEKIDYEFPSLEGQKASMLPFNPQFRAKIEKLGILVRERPTRNP